MVPIRARDVIHPWSIAYGSNDDGFTIRLKSMEEKEKHFSKREVSLPQEEKLEIVKSYPLNSL